MQIFELTDGKQPLRKGAPAVEPTAGEIAVIAAALCAGKGAKPEDADIGTAIDLWEMSTRLLEVRENVKRRKAAVRELLYPDGESPIAVKEFLRLLLPKDSVSKREEFLEDALVRIPSVFVKYFSQDRGWPNERLSAILEHEPDRSGNGIKVLWMERTKDGVSLDTACRFAPFVLAWRTLCSSPRTRGSKSRSATATKPDQNQTGIAETTETSDPPKGLANDQAALRETASDGNPEL